MQRITLSVDDELAQALDRHMKEHRYTSRSEALRDILRDVQARQRLRDDAASESGFCIATMAYVYDHETRDLSQRLTRDQHAHHDLHISTLHVHIDHATCLEVAVLQGAPGEVRALADETMSQRGVRHGHLHVIPAERHPRRHAHGPQPHLHDHVRA